MGSCALRTSAISVPIESGAVKATTAAGSAANTQQPPHIMPTETQITIS